MVKPVPDRMCTRQDIENALREIGVAAGMTLVVHSSLGSLGWVPGGAQSVVDALLAVLGPDGTLVMPAHCGENSDPSYWRNPPVPEAWWPTIRQALPAYDPARSPCGGMGKIAECFRAYPGVRRSNHPTSSFMALGPAAGSILSTHELTCCLGEQSPCGALDRADAWTLLLGVDFDCCTVMHLAEYRSQCRPYFMQGSAMIRDGQPTFATYPETELNSDDFLEPGRQMETDGQVRLGKAGKADMRLFRVRDAVNAAEKWLRQNRLHRLGHDDRGKLMDYLKAEPEYNLFLIGDVENFGMSTDFMDILADERQGSIDSVLLRYHHSFIPYSQNPGFDPKPILAALDTPNLRILSGKQDVLDRLKPHLPDYTWKNTYLMKLGKADLTETVDNKPEPPGVRMKIADQSDVPGLVDFLAGITEFTIQGTREERIHELQTAFANQSSHYYLYYKDDEIIASAGTSAENSISAMVVAVAARRDWRGHGLASRLVTAMSRDLLAERFQYLCLFYDNPAAGRIYRRLGFKDTGLWGMATPPKPIKEMTHDSRSEN